MDRAPMNGPMHDQDVSRKLREQVQAAFESREPLRIVGGGSKAFYGRAVAGSLLAAGEHRGVTDYEPMELVITARAGTTLREIEETLAGEGQMLPFEPPHYGDAATLGGTVACNLSGPRRAYAGAARDFVLGTRVVNGRGEMLTFGGQVMKNVAGYDVSRLMTGALGTLGVLLEVSLKVLPRPELEVTLVQERQQDDALERLHDWAGLPLPVSASCIHDGKLYVRLSGSDAGVTAARRQVGGEELPHGTDLWDHVREHRHAFFQREGTLWRLSVASDAPVPPGEVLLEWGGALRWLYSDASAEQVRDWADAGGGHATRFRGGEGEVFHPLPAGLLAVQRRLKEAFDPAGILNPGRMYPEL